MPSATILAVLAKFGLPWPCTPADLFNAVMQYMIAQQAAASQLFWELMRLLRPLMGC